LKSKSIRGLELGGGVPKELLSKQAYPLQILKIKGGQDYLVQFTDARPDTGGLSGATLQREKVEKIRTAHAGM
jgi:deoxyhypusine synthase